MEKPLIDIQAIGLELIAKNISSECYIMFNDNWLTTYIDNNGQRGHYIVPYLAYGSKIIPNIYVVKRALTFVNKIDIGKENAVLFVLDLNKCNVQSINSNNIVFDSFTIVLSGNPYKHKSEYQIPNHLD